MLRRSVLTAGLAAGLASSAAINAGAQRALAPVRSREAVRSIARAKEGAETLLLVSLDANLSLDSRRAVEGLNERVFGDMRQPLDEKTIEELMLYAEPPQVIIIEQMIQLEVIIVPQTLVPVVPPPLTDAKSEELLDIVVDIIKDTFGVTDLSVTALLEIAVKLALLDFLSQLGKAVRAGNPALAGQVIRAMFTKIASTPGGMPAIESALGKKAAREIFTTVGVRFVPFLGWPILIASLLFNIYKHRERLLVALAKRGGT